MARTDLESKVIGFIRRHRLVSPGELLVVGVSGGADSVCLLHILARRQQELGIKLHAAHLNHELRGAESEADAEYVARLAGSLGIPITIDKQDVASYRAKRKCSLEEAARELRYAFLARVATDRGALRIAIGHTRDDHVETILMHLIRGAGVAGLAGLAPCSPLAYDGQRVSWLPVATSLQAQALASPEEQGGSLSVVRPLLDATRQEIVSYCQKHKLNPRIDSSNLSLSLFRNRVRLHLLPVLRQYNPNIEQTLLRLADIAKEDNSFIEQQAAQLWSRIARLEKDAIHLDRKQLVGLPIALQRQLLRLAIAVMAGEIRDIEANHVEAARSLLYKPAGRIVSLPYGLVCQGGYDEFSITSSARQAGVPPCPLPPLSGETTLKIPGETIFPGWKVFAGIMSAATHKGRRQELILPCTTRLSASHSELSQESLTPRDGFEARVCADFDFDKTGTDLFVRQRRRGDRFQPLGMTAAKKLYRFMVDAKIPRSWRDHIPIVCSPDQIVWVVGWRIDERVKVTEATRRILRLEFIRSK